MDNFIESFKIFSKNYIHLPDEDFLLISKHLKANHYKKRETWVKEGQIKKELFFIVSGVHYVYKSEDGNVVTKSFLKQNDFFIDFNSVLSGLPCDINVECIEDSVVLSIPYEIIQDAYNKSHAICNFGRLMLEKSFADFLTLTSSIKKSPEESYENFIKENPDLINKIPLKILASFIGITPESLSRIRKRIVSIS